MKSYPSQPYHFLTVSTNSQRWVNCLCYLSGLLNFRSYFLLNPVRLAIYTFFKTKFSILTYFFHRNQRFISIHSSYFDVCYTLQNFFNLSRNLNWVYLFLREKLNQSSYMHVELQIILHFIRLLQHL